MIRNSDRPVTEPGVHVLVHGGRGTVAIRVIRERGAGTGFAAYDTLVLTTEEARQLRDLLPSALE